MSILDQIKEKTASMTEDLIMIRRDIHAHPETAWEEVRTSSLVAQRLEKLGYEVLLGDEVCLRDSRMGLPDQKTLDASYDRALKDGAILKYAEKMKDGMTGVIGKMKFSDQGPHMAMRFEMDALPILEIETIDHFPFKTGFNSCYPGNMHACGHDGHTTIGLGVADQLVSLKNQLQGEITLIFQPAEEGVRGAKSIVDHGHLDGIDYFLASHVTQRPKGKDWDLYPGSGGALATSKLNVEIKGRAAHAAMSPEEGHNAALAMATAILNLYSISRHSEGQSRVNIGVARAGTGRNVIPNRAYMEVESRGSTNKINAYIEAYAKRIIEASAQMHGCTAAISLVGEAQSLESDPEMMDEVAKAADLLGLKYGDKRFQLMESEDVSYMMAHVQESGGLASFMRILTDMEDVTHSDHFDFNEEALAKAVNVFTATAYDLLKGPGSPELTAPEYVKSSNNYG